MAGPGSVVVEDGTTIAYEVSGGPGPAVVLLHGAIITASTNFRSHYGVDDTGRIAELPGPTIESALLDAGVTVILVHTRGHGSSGKPHGPESYRGAVHADDVRAVLAELDIGEVAIVGYSMGAITAARLLDDRRVRAVVLSGIEPSMFVSGSTRYDETRSLGQCFVTNEWSEHPEFKPSRAQARLDPDHDFAAIGAALIGLEPPPAGWLSTASVPVLVLNGGNDDPDDAAARLAALIPGATAVVAGDGTHPLAPSDPKFQDALVEFLTHPGSTPTRPPGRSSARD